MVVVVIVVVDVVVVVVFVVFVIVVVVIVVVEGLVVGCFDLPRLIAHVGIRTVTMTYCTCHLDDKRRHE